MADTGHIDAPGSDIRGHQYIVAAGAEAIHGPLPLALAHVALQADGPVPGFF